MILVCPFFNPSRFIVACCIRFKASTSKPNFANARTVRNILDQVIMNQNLRTEDLSDNKTIILEDVEDYLTDEGIDLSKTGKTGDRKIGFV